MRNIQDNRTEDLLVAIASSTKQPTDVRNEAFITLRHHPLASTTVDQLMKLYQQTAAVSDADKIVRGQIIKTLEQAADFGQVERINKFFMELNASKGASNGESAP